jgi:hypothetical protein
LPLPPLVGGGLAAWPIPTPEAEDLLFNALLATTVELDALAIVDPVLGDSEGPASWLDLRRPAPGILEARLSRDPG